MSKPATCGAMWCCFFGGGFLFLFLVTACHYLDYSASQQALERRNHDKHSFEFGFARVGGLD